MMVVSVGGLRGVRAGAGPDQAEAAALAVEEEAVGFWGDTRMPSCSSCKANLGQVRGVDVQ